MLDVGESEKQDFMQGKS